MTWGDALIGSHGAAVTQGLPIVPEEVSDVATIVTVGHGTLSAAAFAALVRDAGVGSIVDVRRFPGSRRNPQFGRDEMNGWLADVGVAYRWMEPLGGIVVVAGLQVEHLFHDGRLADHPITPGARRADGHVVYDSVPG